MFENKWKNLSQHGSVLFSSASVGKVSQLDSMLGSLQSDMTRQGVSTTKKGECAACTKPIIGQVCTALGRTWHPEHFTCVTCEVPLGATNFFERDGRPFCERDYHEQFAPRCAYCSGPILDVSLNFVSFFRGLIHIISYSLLLQSHPTSFITEDSCGGLLRENTE